MIKVKIQNVKEAKQNTKFMAYPFTVKNGRLIILGDIKIDLVKETISIQVDKVNLKNNEKDKSCICLLDTNISKYCLNSKEKVEVLKEVFYMFVCNSRRLYSDVYNWKLAMFKLIEENYQDKYCPHTYSLLEELLHYKEEDFNGNEKNSRQRLIISIRNSVKVIQEKKELHTKFEVQSLDNLNKTEIIAYSNIMTRYLENKKDDGRINIEYGDHWGETTANYSKLIKYTISPIFPNKEIMEDALRHL